MCFLVGSLPPVTLINEINKVGGRTTHAGAVWVDCLDTFLQMKPRPLQVFWSHFALRQCARSDALRVMPSAEAVYPSVIMHLEYCCPHHQGDLLRLFPTMYPNAAQACFTTDHRVGVTLLRKEVEKMWPGDRRKACIQVDLVDVL